jgi:tetratricopeptide (TPR) repeat protein
MKDIETLRQLFVELIEVPAEDWEAWFEQRQVDTAMRQELMRLAAADGLGDGPLDRSLGDFAQSLGSDPGAAASRLGQRVGPFRILAAIGEGGMASVFLAQREDADFEQTVALKLLRLGTMSEMEQAYFRRERRVLARLSHPGIARLVDGGIAADGTPYLAMQYVDGVAITRWCRERECGIDARVELVAKLARAVAAAHAELVVHRDIKPSNVLVDARGEPTLLDFGIAKLLRDDETSTRPGYTPMTPQYAAPEQLRGEPVTTATDVHALGLLLYELLAGELPDRQLPRPPSQRLSLRRADSSATSSTTLRVARDLDRVTMMAISPEPTHRYASATAFADDLERFLARQPVRAHPPSLWYRTRKFVQRHRGGVTATVLLVLGMIASLAIALLQARAAQLEATRARTIQSFLIGAVEAARAVQPRDERPGLDEVVAAAATQVESDRDLDPATRTELLLVLGKVALGSSDVETAATLLTQAREAAAGLAPRHAVRWSLSVWEARLRFVQGRVEDALAALDVADTLPPPDDPGEVLEARMDRASLLYASGSVDAALALGADVVADAERVFAAQPARALPYRFNYGQLLALAQKYRAAIETLQLGIERHEALGLPPRIDFLGALAGLSQAEARVGDLERAQQSAERALALSRAIYDPPHSQIARTLAGLGIVLNARGQTAASAQVFREALDMRRALLGAGHAHLIPALLNVGTIESLLGRYVEALAYFREAEQACRTAPAATRTTCGLVRHRIANMHYKLGEHAEAEREALAARDLRIEVFGPRSGDLASTLALLSNIARADGREALALTRAEEAVAMLAALPDPARNVRAEVGLAQVRALIALGRLPEAERESASLLAWWRTDSPQETFFLSRMLTDRHRILVASGRAAEAADIVADLRAMQLDSAELEPETRSLIAPGTDAVPTRD